MATNEPNCDEKSYELAEHFAQGEGLSKEEIAELANDIQHAVDLFFGAREV